MLPSFRANFISLALCAAAHSQTGPAAHIISGPVLPTTCSILSGDVFVKTGASSGLYLCNINGTYSIISSTVTTISVATANGFAGTVANQTTTPAISVKFDPALATGIVKSTTVTGVASIAAAADTILQWSGTCDSTSVLGADGICKVISSAYTGITGVLANSILGNNTGSTANAIALTAAQVITLLGNIPVSSLNSGTGASGSTFWRGDGTWAAAGAGTVTTVSVVTANGVSGTVANASTTPAITLTLGAITPTSVTSSGVVQAGTTATKQALISQTSDPYPGLWLTIAPGSISTSNYTLLNAGSGTLLNSPQSGDSITFALVNSNKMRLSGTNGNLLIGSPLTDGNYKLDVQQSGSTGTVRFFDQTATSGATRVLVSLGAADSASTVTVTNAGTTKSAGYQSSDGTAGATVTTCTGFKNGLCISGT